MKQLTIKDRIRAIYFALSFCLFIGLDIDNSSAFWIVLLAVNFAYSVWVIQKVNFDTIK
ncbi:MAG: hypothetical protein RR555_05415 [Bacteroidales bacterium]